MLKKLFGIPEFPREPAFAGMFYPADEQQLRRLTLVEGSGDARLIVVPHSDLNITAPIAAAGFAQLADAKRIVVLGPSHKIPFAGVAVPNADGWTTPLGTLRIDVAAYEDVEDLGLVRVMDVAFDPEPAIELQLPFVQQRFGDKVCVVPFLCGDASPDRLLELLDRVADDSTAIVVACELSHDLPADEVAELDRELLGDLVRLEPERLRRGRATARALLSAAVQLASSRGWSCEEIRYSTSHDLGGPQAPAAGYASLAMGPS